MPQILVICTANICRSPVVAALLSGRLRERGLDWRVESAGTWARPGLAASDHSISVLAEREGIDISHHRSREVTAEMLATADLVLCMTANHVEALKVEFAQEAHKIYRLAEMVGDGYDIADPYGGPRAAYERMVTVVGALVDAGLDEIVQRVETATTP